MNSFDVPYDENLFESNDFMKSYWERSTQNRNVAFVQDLRTTEVVTDDGELKYATMKTFNGLDDKSVDDKEDELDDEKLDDSVRVVDTTFNKKRANKIVLPKSESSVSIIWSFIAVGAIYLFLINLKSYKLRE